MPKMVIQKHTRDDATHYDLMLESQQTLWTWRFHDLPGSKPRQHCERSQDHDPGFLEYEGELSPGNGRVDIVEGGSFDLLSAREDEVDITARSGNIAGFCRLERKTGNDWVLICRK